MQISGMFEKSSDFFENSEKLKQMTFDDVHLVELSFEIFLISYHRSGQTRTIDESVNTHSYLLTILIE